jgi:hypothetical protein
MKILLAMKTISSQVQFISMTSCAIDAIILGAYTGSDVPSTAEAPREKTNHSLKFQPHQLSDAMITKTITTHCKDLSKKKWDTSFILFLLISEAILTFAIFKYVPYRNRLVGIHARSHNVARR